MISTKKERASLGKFLKRISKFKNKSSSSDTTGSQQQSNYLMQHDRTDSTRALTHLFTKENYYNEVIYFAESLNSSEAGVDTCSSCMAFADVRYFDVLDLNKAGEIRLLDTVTKL